MSDVFSFPGVADLLNSFTETVAAGATSATGAWTDVLDFGSIDIIVTSPTSNIFAVFVDWSDDGSTLRRSDPYTFTPSGASWDSGTRRLRVPAAAEFYRVRVYNTTIASKTFTVSAYLRPPSVDLVQLGFVGGSEVQNAQSDVGGTGDHVIQNLQPNMSIVVLSYQLSMGGVATSLYWRDGGGGAQLSMLHRLSVNAFVSVAPRNDAICFRTGVGNSLVVNSSGANPWSAQCQFVYEPQLI